MTEAAATAPAPNAVAPAAIEQAPPVASAEAAPVESSERKLEKQIERALKKGRAKLAAAAKGTPAKGPDGKFLPASKDGNAGKPAPASAAAGEAPADGKEPAAAPPAKQEPEKASEPSLSRARELLAAGDIEAAFREAFGKAPQDFKIDSRRWEEWRKAGTRQKQDLERRVAEARATLEGERKQLEGTLADARKELGPLLEGRKLFQAGDFAGALQAAFGVDVAGFQRKLLAQHHGKNPEVESLRAELRAEREAREARERAEQEQREQATQQEQVRQYIESCRAELVDGEDPELAGLATKPRFMQRVFQILRQHYDGSRTIPVKTAAEMAREEIVTEFGGVFGRAPRDTAVPVEPAQPGSKAVSSGRRVAPVASLPQRGAAETSAPGRKLTAQEQVDKFTNLARAQLGH